MNKIRKLYIVIAIFVMAGMVVTTIHTLIASPLNIQQSIESRLPTGDYLPNADNPLIRVVIKTNGFQHIAHNKIEISAEHGLLIKNEKQTMQEIAPNEHTIISPENENFQKGSIWITAKADNDRIVVHSLTRGYGIPSYRGKLELYSTAEGIVIVNELPVEEYLYAVVPSEMPASYQKEALKCQAICARSYAYCQMQVYGYPEYYAHVDDSVSYQVYGNSAEKETTKQAVNETTGKKLWYKGEVVKTYYYSTSCGHSTSVEAWGTKLTEDNHYLKGVPICDENGDAYETAMPWYRWEAVISCQMLSNLIELNTGEELGDLQNVEITKKGIGGVALQLTVTGTKKTITIETENKIRSVLGGGGYQITKQDGTKVKSTKLLPSAFFTIERNDENYIVKGGGYGHGIGMSQNGANEMAKAGKTYEEILEFFYPNTQVM